MSLPHWNDATARRLKRKLAGKSGSRLDRFWRKVLPGPLPGKPWQWMRTSAKGRFQRSLSLMAGASSILAGLEVSYEHYSGSYGQKIMWTPVVLSGAMTGAGVWRISSARGRLAPCCGGLQRLTLLDSLVGFYFHVRGIARKPGGWRMPVANIVMGPPIFAPLLFGVSAYLGFDRLLSSGGGGPGI